MATDWSARDAALKYFEKVPRGGHIDREYAEEAVNALRRSQDHTAIQSKLNNAIKILRECDEYLSRGPLESIGAGSILHQAMKNVLNPVKRGEKP